MPRTEGTILAATGAVTLTGVRHTKGNAVDCPQIMTDDGALHSVSRLTADVAIGDRVTVTGTYGVTTTCVGQVLVIDDLKRL